MSGRPVSKPFVEPERYEFHSSPAYHFELDRRELFKLLGSGVLIVCVAREAASFQESGRRRMFDEELPKKISSWLHIGEIGVATVYTGKVEMGQNIRTSLTQAVAEELHVASANIRLVMGDTNLTPFDMGTFGSRTTTTMSPQLRRAAAAARDVLVDMAARTWNLDRTKLVAENGRVNDPAGGRSIEYAVLLKGQEIAETIPAEDPLEAATDWKVMGASLPKISGEEFVTGKHQYASDIKLPGMWYGEVLRPPSFGATLVSLDSRGAEALLNVVVVHDGDFVGVAAASTRQGSQALAALKAEWKPVPQPSDKELFDYLKRNAEGGGDRFRHNLGSIEEGLAKADERLKQTYTVAYIAHAPLEPRAAVTEWKDGKLTVWTGSQRPFAIRSELASAFRVPESQVRVQVPDTGAAYGGKHTGETAIEAARLAKAAGRPVKVVWTREEEFTWAYFRPAGVIEISSGVRSDGLITAWECHNFNSGAAAIGTPYAIPNQRIEFHPTKSPLRQGSYRGLAATANHFARESHMDELAHRVRLDPLQFRLANLQDERLKAVFQAAAEKFGWGRAKTSPDRGFGIAGGVEKGGYTATCAEVSVDRAGGHVRLERLVTSFECGAVVNPDGLRNQVEGANVMGIGGALFEAIEFADGRIVNSRFSRYRVPRFSDVPPIEVVLLGRKDLPSAGAGETPIVGVAPAIANAIFDATGVRLRSMPLAPSGLKA
jgi:CO/xanthine dehydrogenase Mo-binding subunit